MLAAIAAAAAAESMCGSCGSDVASDVAGKGADIALNGAEAPMKGGNGAPEGTPKGADVAPVRGSWVPPGGFPVGPACATDAAMSVALKKSGAMRRLAPPCGVSKKHGTAMLCSAQEIQNSNVALMRQRSAWAPVL